MPAAASVQKTLTFIQYDIPPLKAGEYTITAAQTVNQIAPNAFSAAKQFAVPGNRFCLNGDDIVSVFPAPLANGEFTGVMPLVVLKRQTLPWQRTSVFSEDDAPWLALLLLEEGEQPEVQAGTAANVISGDIFVAGNKTSVGVGTLPTGITSYPNINPLDYGQAPTDACNYIDLDVDLFSRICPSASDLPFLAHIRQTDTFDSVDNGSLEETRAIVLGNRWPKANSNAYVYLVSLENMGNLLPDDSGGRSPNLPAGQKIRLITFRTWRFFANDLDEKFQSLCENLNKVEGVQGLSTLRLPAATPDPGAVAAALADQGTGSLSDTDAGVLIQNALCLGYTALNHHTRDGGDIVSWYRGPFAPYPVGSTDYTIASCPDALLRYDPQTGLFDASYAQAWQLGQLMALSNTAFSVALYNWKQTLQKGAAAEAEAAEIQQLLGGSDAFSNFFARRARFMTTAQAPSTPKPIADWLGQLKLLKGAPFSALVPDEGMLPVESLRFFHVDQDWVAALIDGAFSIGRFGADGAARDAHPLTRASVAARASARSARKNNAPHIRAALSAAGNDVFSSVSGVLLRSQLVSGWPRLQLNGYSDSDATIEVAKLRMEQLSNDVMICLFEGDIQALAIHEAPEQLHCGVEGNATVGFTTTLRQVVGATPGQQYLTDPKGGEATAAVAVRSDGQTLRAAATATAILTKLNSDFAQGLTTFTSAEFALEMVKGVVRVEFKRQ